MREYKWGYTVQIYQGTTIFLKITCTKVPSMIKDMMFSSALLITKKFDNQSLLERLQEIGVDGKNTRIMKLY